MHIGADVGIGLAYMMIPLALARYCWIKRAELAFPKVIWLFAAFIFSCGSTHFVEAVIFYEPIYRFSALMKVITALVSWGTVIAIIRIAPKALELPGLRRANQLLKEQLGLVRETSDALAKSNQELAAFTGTVTHDLRNPMSGALFMAELAKESAQVGNTDMVLTQLEVVLESLRDMDKFVTDLHARAVAKS